MAVDFPSSLGDSSDFLEFVECIHNFGARHVEPFSHLGESGVVASFSPGCGGHHQDEGIDECFVWSEVSLFWIHRPVVDLDVPFVFDGFHG